MKTQKVAGLMKCDVSWMEKISIFVHRKGDPVQKTWPSTWGGEVFVRPCPKRPRHGFLDSFKCSAAELPAALERVWQEMEAVGEGDGEVILCRYIPAAYNAVICPGSITIGPGHDGATAGNGAITLPFPGFEVWGWDKEWGSPYVEAVYDGKNWYATQFRGGPPATAADDFVVDGYTVSEVFDLRTGYSLVEWERLVKTFPQGTVVYHPGGAVTSHYGVHCVSAGIPYFTSRRPAVGEVLRAEKRPPRGVLKAFRQYLKTVRISECGMPDAALAALYVLHNSARFTTEQFETLIPLFAAVWVRLGTALVLGEARHTAVSHEIGCPIIPFSRKGYSRDGVYYDAATSLQIKVTVEEAHKCFSECKWNSGYGGKAWARCARSIIAMKKARSTADLLRAWNRSVHLAHNNGWWFNKILTFDEFTHIDSPYHSIRAALAIFKSIATYEPIVRHIDFELQWRILEEGRIRVQSKEHKTEDDVMLSGYPSAEEVEFNLKSTANTDKMYARCYLRVREGIPFLEFLLKNGDTKIVPLKLVELPDYLDPATLIKSYLRGINYDKHKLVTW